MSKSTSNILSTMAGSIHTGTQHLPGHKPAPAPVTITVMDGYRLPTTITKAQEKSHRDQLAESLELIKDQK